MSLLRRSQPCHCGHHAQPVASAQWASERRVWHPPRPAADSVSAHALGCGTHAWASGASQATDGDGRSDDPQQHRVRAAAPRQETGVWPPTPQTPLLTRGLADNVSGRSTHFVCCMERHCVIQSAAGKEMQLKNHTEEKVPATSAGENPH